MRNRLRRVSLMCTALVALTVAPGARAQSSSDADMKEVGAYRLTMDVFTRMAGVNRVLYEQMQRDPTTQEKAKLKAELKAIQQKDETSEAEDKRIEEIQHRLEALEEAEDRKKGPDDGMNDAKTLTEMARAFERNPVFANALKREGVSAREYATFMLASLQASMTAGFMNSKLGIDRSKLTPTQLANAKFVHEHQAELARLQPTDKPE